MKKTTTRTKEIWVACGCGGSCNLCNGTGKFLSEITTETITEETSEKDEDVVEAEVIPGFETMTKEQLYGPFIASELRKQESSEIKEAGI